jgi:AcrR family transcriptional regulator
MAEKEIKKEENGTSNNENANKKQTKSTAAKAKVNQKTTKGTTAKAKANQKTAKGTTAKAKTSKKETKAPGTKKTAKDKAPQEKVNKKKEQGEKTKTRIFQETFRLFMHQSYESVTIEKIEKAVGVTRGAIFHHVDNKLDLFNKVVERYFLDTQNVYKLISEDILEKDITLLEFIDIYVSAIEKNCNTLYIFYGINRHTADKKAISKAECSYLTLLTNAGYYLDDYTEKIHYNLLTHQNTWSFFIQKAIEKGEIKPNVNAKLLGQIFSSVYMGKFFYDAFHEGIDEKRLKELFMVIYNTIKA